MKYIILIIILSFSQFSCKKDDDLSTTNTELEGTWKTPCYAHGSRYRIKSLSVTGSTFVDTLDIYNDSSCTTQRSTWVDTYSSLSIGDAITFSEYGSSGGSGKQYTMTFNSVTETPQNSVEVNWYNNNSYCGDSDWALNTAHDTTGKTCGGSTRWSANTTIYGLYLLDGNSLFIEDSNSSYPTSVDTGANDTLTKQ